MAESHRETNPCPLFCLRLLKTPSLILENQVFAQKVLLLPFGFQNKVQYLPISVLQLDFEACGTGFQVTECSLV